jgi:hypothetical protein
MRFNAFRHLASLLLVISISLAGLVAYASDGEPAREILVSEINYQFVGHREEFDDQGRLLVWVASIEGGLTGELKWWFVQPPPVASTAFEGGRVDYYAARWEIWADDDLLLAGDSAGKTVWHDGADGIWDGHGIVVEAHGDFSGLKGRKTYETGPVFMGANPPVSFSGTGMFLIY